MKFLVSLLLLATLAIISIEAYRPPVVKPHPNRPPFPSFPGQGPFNPRPRRSPDNNGQISINAKKEGGKTSWNVEAQQKIWENKHGSIHVSGGSNKLPGHGPQSQVGIGGSFKWG
ncbi:uncharacterized protein LOC106639493 [Copidosoma floridanum]|uniref:uncharacterized protein LOC106639493 n=1 Tax=Copidosoma floridanum TaxID=29053 RepID=UPI0006C9697C|nr:uncharacterized protein LOC106639493 [Copidosoma floridanum]